MREQRKDEIQFTLNKNSRVEEAFMSLIKYYKTEVER
jgi:hypothetical protein